MKDKYADQLLEEMVDRYASPLLSWAYRKTGSSLEAQDLSPGGTAAGDSRRAPGNGPGTRRWNSRSICCGR